MDIADNDGNGSIDVEEFPAVIKIFFIQALRVAALGKMPQDEEEKGEEEQKETATAEEDQEIGKWK